MSPWTARATRAMAAVLAVLLTAACGGGGFFKPRFEYTEDLHPALDGSAELYVNGSVAALVALHGLDLPTDPAARIDRAALRRLFEAPGVTVGTPTLSRRDGRRFAHLKLEAVSLAALQAVPALRWSRYGMTTEGEQVTFTQHIGPAVNRPVGDVGWTGQERLAFRLHPPSRIFFHNSKQPIERGNILTWEQPLAARLAGEPIEVEVRMESSSILARTLLLFGATILAAAVAFAVVIWLVARRGRSARA